MRGEGVEGGAAEKAGHLRINQSERRVHTPTGEFGFILLTHQRWKPKCGRNRTQIRNIRLFQDECCDDTVTVISTEVISRLKQQFQPVLWVPWTQEQQQKNKQFHGWLRTAVRSLPQSHEVCLPVHTRHTTHLSDHMVKDSLINIPLQSLYSVEDLTVKSRYLWSWWECFFVFVVLEEIQFSH